MVNGSNLKQLVLLMVNGYHFTQLGPLTMLVESILNEISAHLAPPVYQWSTSLPVYQLSTSFTRKSVNTSPANYALGSSGIGEAWGQTFLRVFPVLPYPTSHRAHVLHTFTLTNMYKSLIYIYLIDLSYWLLLPICIRR